MRLLTLASAAIAFVAATPAAQSQTAGPATSAGPGRVICETATLCQLGIGDPATIKYQINIQDLPAADKDRLSKQCKPNGETPCVVTINGTEIDDPLKVKAAKITWYN
jgi:hypothetical protein